MDMKQNYVTVTLCITRRNRLSDRRRERSHVCLHEATVNAISGAIIVAIADSYMSVVTARSSAQRLIHVNTP